MPETETDLFDSDEWRDIASRCDAAGIRYEHNSIKAAASARGGETLQFKVLRFPAHASPRRIVLFPEDLKSFQEVEFEQYEILGDYNAVWNRDEGFIEAALIAESSRTPMVRALRSISNFEDLDRRALSKGVRNDLEAEAEEIATTMETTSNRRPVTAPDKWRICAARGAASIELSPASAAFQQLLLIRDPNSRIVTLKITGVDNGTGEGALRSLQEIGGSLTFELDVRNNIQLTLGRVRTAFSRPRTFGELPIQFPGAIYPQEPLELYQYGRSSSGLPLLQFLAYYQVVEFFFPVYSRQEVAHRLRMALRQPRFDVDDDISLNRLLTAILPEGRSGMGERDQLRLTLRACVESEMIREFIESYPEYKRHFTHKTQAIRGASRILLYDGQPDLRDQAADRIYAIRCRVVHTKQDGRDSEVDLLLPSSPEARSLEPDIALVRLVGQQALVAAGHAVRF